MTNFKFYLLTLLLCLAACSAKKKPTLQEQLVTPPAFSADSAMSYLQQQCAYGPRTPGSAAHDSCVAFISSKLDAWGIPYEVQTTTAMRYDGLTVPVQNITAHIYPTASNRVLFLAHYDCRPWADNDPDSAHWHTPVMGANDAASGVAVLLEVARQLSLADSLSTGVDLLFDDAEDLGTPQFAHSLDNPDTWCLGTQCWAREQASRGYKAQYGVLLDMVGDAGAVFPREFFSDRQAEGVVSMVWSAAAELGYGNLFLNQQGGGITDDHLPINRTLHIPCIDIIHHDPQSGAFPSTWHTVQDTPDHCSAQTLQQVGQVLLYILK